MWMRDASRVSLGFVSPLLVPLFCSLLVFPRLSARVVFCCFPTHQNFVMSISRSGLWSTKNNWLDEDGLVLRCWGPSGPQILVLDALVGSVVLDI